MASWTNEIWQHTETMFEHGTEACHIPKNTLFIQCDKTKNVKLSRYDAIRNPGKRYQMSRHNLSSSDVIRRREMNGMVLYPTEKTLQLMKRSHDLSRIMDNWQNSLNSGTLRPYSEAGRLEFNLWSFIHYFIHFN